MSKHRKEETTSGTEIDLGSGFVVDTDRDRLDIDQVHRWLSKDSEWAKDRTLETVSMAADASLNFGVYSDDGQQVGYARVVTDGVTCGWLCDAFIEPAVRDRGLGKDISQAIVDTLAPLNMERIVLLSDDADQNFSNVGFEEYSTPEQVMVLESAQS